MLGIGIDILSIYRIKKMKTKFKKKLYKKILTKIEKKKYKKTKYKDNFLAKKFVAKEAASKALGTGINKGIYFNNFEIYNDHLGKPKIKLLKNAKKKFIKKKAKNILISISDEKKYAQAIVLIE